MSINIPFEDPKNISQIYKACASCPVFCLKQRLKCGSGLTIAAWSKIFVLPTLSAPHRGWEILKKKFVYMPGDDCLDERWMSLKIFGRTIGITEAEETIENVLTSYSLTKSQLHSAQLLHGSSSASLIAFTKYSDSEGALLPLGILEKIGQIPFCGEILQGRKQINAERLSTVWVGRLEQALRYAKPSKWSPDLGKEENKLTESFLKDWGTKLLMGIKKIKNSSNEESGFCENSTTSNEKQFELKYYEELYELVKKIPEMSGGVFSVEMALNSIIVNQKRLVEWEKLDDEERSLVSSSFPVLYGLKSFRRNVHEPVSSDIPGEISLKLGALPGEIKVIFVPKEKVDFVKDLLERHNHLHIAVEPFSGFFQAV